MAESVRSFGHQRFRKQIHTSKKKDTQTYIQKVQTCAPVLSLSQKKRFPEDSNHTYKNKERYVAFYCTHTQTYSFSEIIPDR